MSNSHLPPAIFLMGPTASGKTDLAIQLCQHLPCEIISVDSALVYRGLDIGSAKPSAEELALAPHRLIDIRDPSESYSVAEFREDALREMADITAKGNIPLLVGGTMLYYKALLDGLADMPETKPDIRAAIEADAELHGWPSIHAQLAVVDPDSAARIHPNHSQRIERALNIYRSTGVTMTELHRRQQNQPPVMPDYNYLQFAIAPHDRKILHQRIADRFHKMMELGFLEEVQTLRSRDDLHANLPAIRAVGYRQAWEHLQGDYDLPTMLEKGVVATRQLAKRQFTWLNGWDGLHWILTDDQQQCVNDHSTEHSIAQLNKNKPIDFVLRTISHYFGDSLKK